MKTSLFDFYLPDSFIASHPVNPRDAARMLILPPSPAGGRVGEGAINSYIKNLCDFLRPGDMLVFNDTRVIPARLPGRRGEAKVEVLLHKQYHPEQAAGESMDPAIPRQTRDDNVWQCFAKPARRLTPGDRIDFAENFHAEVMEKLPDGQVVLAFNAGGTLREMLKTYGHMPLPPYIRRDDTASDRERYQTVYARHEGSVAAPTAGLHFTESLLEAIDAAGAGRVSVTLHVGGGTFLPVKAEDTDNHIMHSEHAIITQEAADAINRAKEKGGRVIAVGTTSLRVLESAADDNGIVRQFDGETDIFITPGYRFKAVDMLLTNFHLPRSTLFMLVCAFAGMERMKAAYIHAVEQKYRFYSYGDACLLYQQPI
ncbi:MAG: tRNA preQ1(34) S-adenosylmethionine ribosyltransferase-isomerase QueA [Pseudomonadota bacterium]|nr:tRNA preQ1(34) S-adenosylmethionine ribosyltransferase-isomerase QueA [Pseudomonadota bacterium]MDE3038193.1 tRNA preQ1(34) S-adenosylmethionine ribosyltransferase-isomerase QueA [Pseudomonadota bacterium]